MSELSLGQEMELNFMKNYFDDRVSTVRSVAGKVVGRLADEAAKLKKERNRIDGELRAIKDAINTNGGYVEGEDYKARVTESGHIFYDGLIDWVRLNHPEILERYTRRATYLRLRVDRIQPSVFGFPDSALFIPVQQGESRLYRDRKETDERKEG